MVGKQEITLTLPWPPSVNTYWRRRGNVYFISKQGLEYTKMVKLLSLRHKKIDGKVSLYIEAYPPDKRRRDLDNILKAILDSLQKANLIEDDSDIDDLHIVRKEIQREGKILLKMSNNLDKIPNSIY